MQFIILICVMFLSVFRLEAGSTLACNRWKCKSLEGIKNCVHDVTKIEQELMKAHPNCTRAFIESLCGVNLSKEKADEIISMKGAQMTLKSLCRKVGAPPSLIEQEEVSQRYAEQLALHQQKILEEKRSLRDEENALREREALAQKRLAATQQRRQNLEQEADMRLKQQQAEAMAQRDLSHPGSFDEGEHYDAAPADFKLNLNEIVLSFTPATPIAHLMKHHSMQRMIQKIKRAKKIKIVHPIDFLPRANGALTGDDKKRVKEALNLKKSQSYEVFMALLPYLTEVRAIEFDMNYAYVTGIYQTADLTALWQDYIRRFLKEIMRSDSLEKLVFLDVSGCFLGSDGEVPHIFTDKRVKANRLEFLDLRGNALNDETVAKILSSASLKRLRHLFLDRNEFGERSFRALTDSPFKGTLVELSLVDAIKTSALAKVRGKVNYRFPGMPQLTTIHW